MMYNNLIFDIFDIVIKIHNIIILIIFYIYDIYIDCSINPYIINICH